MRWLGAILGIVLIVGAVFAMRSFRAARVHDEDIIYFPPTHARAKTSRPVRKSETPAQSSFRKTAVQILNELPRQDSNKPNRLLGAAPGLAAIFDSLNADASLIPDGLDFYRDCTASEELLVAVRAVCFKNYRYWNSRSPASQTADDFASEQIKKLADNLSTIR